MKVIYRYVASKLIAISIRYCLFLDGINHLRVTSSVDLSGEFRSLNSLLSILDGAYMIDTYYLYFAAAAFIWQLCQLFSCRNTV